MERSHLGTREDCFYVCFQTSKHPCDRRWFSLWLKPDDHRTLTCYTSKYKSTGNWLLPVPCSYSPRLPRCYEIVGSETYEIGGQDSASSSTDVWVSHNLIGERRKAPSMTVARKNALTCSLDGKLYVMGGCESAESTYWAEVFDPKTQTWEPLPDLGPALRFSPVKKLELLRGTVFVRSKKKNFEYLLKEGRWLGLDEVLYGCDNYRCVWYDTKCDEWKSVKGLSGLDRYCRTRIDTEIGNYGGKLVIVWVGPAVYPLLYTPEIWCAVILLEKHHDGEVWGRIEWADHVLTVPREYTLLHCMDSLQ